MINAYFEHRATNQIWLIDFELWVGGDNGQVAAAGIQGCIITLFDKTKQCTFTQNYSPSLAEMKKTFKRALPD